MSVLGDAVMAAAAAAAMKGTTVLGSTVVGMPLNQQRGSRMQSRGGGSTATRNSELSGREQEEEEAAELVAAGVAAATSDNPEPILARGALVRSRNDGLMECRPLFEPMRSNAKGADKHPGLEPTVLINTSFISQIDGQSEKLQGASSSAGGANVAKFVQDHRALMLNFFRLEFQASEYVDGFRRAIGLPWYTKAPMLLMLLLILSGSGLLLFVQHEVAKVRQGIDALHVAPPVAPDFSDRTFDLRVKRHYITPGRNARVCRCTHWAYDPRIRYHAIDFTAFESNAYSLLHGQLNRSIVRSMSVYSETAPAAASGYGYCSSPSTLANHECPALLDGSSTMELIWHWSTASGWPHAKTARPLSFAGTPMDGSSSGTFLLAIDFEPSGFPSPISSSPFSFWDESGVSVRLTSQRREQGLATITLTNTKFDTTNTNHTASHCFVLSLRGGEQGTAGSMPVNSSVDSLRAQGLVSVVSWSMRTRSAGIGTRISAWRPVLPAVTAGVDLGRSDWRETYAAMPNASNSTGQNANLSWQFMWAANESSYNPVEPHTHAFGASTPAAARCSCYGPGYSYSSIVGGCVQQNSAHQDDTVLALCDSILQDGDVICTACTYTNNGTSGRIGGPHPTDELCMGQLTVFPADSVIERRHIHAPKCGIGFYHSNTSASDCVDTDECASNPCGATGTCAESNTVSLSDGAFARIGPSAGACRFVHPNDNFASYFTLIIVGAFDRNACERECEADTTGTVCRGYEYQAGTGKCELWHKLPGATAPVEGYQCFVRVGTAGSYACT